MDSRILKGDCKVKNSLDWGVCYIIGKLLERKCLKWACMTHLDIWNTNYGQKKGQKSNWQFESWPLKVKNRPDFLAFRWCATYRWKALDKGYNFALDRISIEGLQTKLWAPKVAGIPKVAGVPTLGISRLPLGSPGTKCYLDASSVTNHKVYYKGEGGGFPQVRAMVNLVSMSLPWLVLAQKMLKLCTNQLVVWFVQVCVSNWCLSLFLVPILKLHHAPLPPKCYEPRNVPQLLALPLFSP
jgi:hypothetical protein